MATEEKRLTLLDLPKDVLKDIQEQLGTDFKAHVALSQSCQSLRALYEDKEDSFWRELLYRNGYSRSISIARENWKFQAAAIAYHIDACVSCRNLHDQHMKTLPEGEPLDPVDCERF